MSVCFYRGISLVLLFILFAFAGNSLSAQDTIVKRDGMKIPAKILEVNSAEIHYKRSDSPDGPLYVVKPWELLAIIYAGGRTESYESIQPPPVPLPAILQPQKEDLSIQLIGKHYYYREHAIGETDMLALASKINDKKVNLLIKKVDEKRMIQNGALIAGSILFVAGLYEYAANGPKRGGRRRGGSPAATASNTSARQTGEFMMLGAVGCAAVAITFKFDRTRHAHMVVSLYNQSILR